MIGTREKILGAVVGVAMVSAIAFTRARNTKPTPGPTPSDPPIGEIVPWCAEGLEALPGGGCFAAPVDAKSAPIIVYLHGRYEASAPEEELDRQKRVAQKATQRGFAVLAFRGEVGACQRPDLATWVCWPSNERTADAGPTFVARWETSLAIAAKRTSSPRRLVLGFSNGAYFAGLIALRGLWDASAFVVAAGGPTEPVDRRATMPPVLLLTGDEDPSIDDTMRFDRMLTKIGWPHEIHSRDGGHLLTDADIALALTFFERSAREPVPLAPPLSTRRPNPVRRDAAPPEAAVADADAPSRIGDIAEDTPDAAE